MEDIRIGFVSSFDASSGKASIYYPDRSGTVTQKLKVFAPLGCKQTLSKDDQVLVLHLSNGSEAGVVIGKLIDGNASVNASGGALALTANGEISLSGSAGSITLSELIQIKNEVL